MAWSERQLVEIFHLTFLGALGAKLDGKLYAIKGGCNLRFFFGSPRFSEDLDIDVRTVDRGTLHRKIDRILESKTVDLVLASRDVEIVSWSAPKQTDTTQRWKVGLSTRGTEGVHTKIELSRRRFGGGTDADPPDPNLVRTYGLAPTILTHYGRDAAAWQKVLALADRSETQARDVFDLDLLLRVGARLAKVPPEASGRVRTAIAHADSVDFDAFVGQVLPYLPEEVASTFDRTGWAKAAHRVKSALESAEP